MVESPSNNVEVAVGTDADGDGILGVDEADWTFGYDCGRWFAREWKIENGEWKMSDAFSTFHFPFSIQEEGRVERKFVLNSKGLDARWNLARVTRRGLGVSAEQVLVKCRQQGTSVFVR